MKTPSKPDNWKLEEWEDVWDKIESLKRKKSAHWNAYRICNKWDKVINLPVVLLSSILSTGAISQTVASEQSAVIGYCISAASLIVTGLTTFSKYMNYGELKEAHRQVSLNYYRLYTDLSTKVERRKNDPDTDDDESKTIVYSYEQFLTDYYTKLTSIRENAPILPNVVFKQFLKEKQGALGNQLSKIVIDKFKKHENSIKSAEKLVQQQFVEHLDIFDDLQNILTDKESKQNVNDNNEPSENTNQDEYTDTATNI